MKNVLKTFKRQDGFTLVELMVVVAIIGLLSAVAIPNFRKYQAKAKMSEAKLQLSSVYTAQTAFFSDYNIYHSCLVYMGYNPHREVKNRYYAIGFPTGLSTVIDTGAYQAAQNAGLNTTDCPATATSAAGATGGTTPLVLGSITNNMAWFGAGKGVGNAMAGTQNFLGTAANYNYTNGQGVAITTPLGTQANQTAMTFSAGAGGVIDGDFTTNTTASLMFITEQKIFKVVRNGY